MEINYHHIGDYTYGYYYTHLPYGTFLLILNLTQVPDFLVHIQVPSSLGSIGNYYVHVKSWQVKRVTITGRKHSTSNQLLYRSLPVVDRSVLSIGLSYMTISSISMASFNLLLTISAFSGCWLSSNQQLLKIRGRARPSSSQRYNSRNNINSYYSSEPELLPVKINIAVTRNTCSPRCIR